MFHFIHLHKETFITDITTKHNHKCHFVDQVSSLELDGEWWGLGMCFFFLFLLFHEI